MPRKYHRPPAVKRRKSKKAQPFVYESVPESDDAEDTELAASAEELDEEDWAAETESAVAPGDIRRKGREPTRHLVKDYSYVRGEVVRILGLAAFLIVSLLLTALLRN